MSIAGLFILLAIAISVRLIGNRLVPVLMPTGAIKTVGLGWAGGFAASWLDGVFWQFGPELAGINLAAAVVGCVVFVLCLGIAPFVKILLGKT